MLKKAFKVLDNFLIFLKVLIEIVLFILENVVFPKSHASVAVLDSAVPSLGLLFTAVCMYLLCNKYFHLFLY